MRRVWAIGMSVLMLTGCPEAETEVTSLGMDLRACLGAIDGDRVCRGGLDGVVAATPVNACLVVRRQAGGAVGALPLQWSGGRLSNPLNRSLDFAPGVALEASLFFLSSGDADGGVCNAFAPDSACGETCVLKLRQPELIAAADGTTTFNFSENGQCLAEQGPAAGVIAAETCDGADNDCDGVVDEEIAGAGDACEDGVGGCRREGAMQCADGVMACSVVAGPAAENEQGAQGCDGVDDDCDGEVDEDIACSPCASDEDCAENIAGGQCVDGLCTVCDPADHGGCGPDQLCCDGACVDTDHAAGPCETCETRCVADREGEAVLTADVCVDRSCRCNGGEGCGGDTPFCTQAGCVECREDTHCGPESLCCEGRCVQTDPAVQCERCGVACNDTAANRCVGRSCRCGSADACGQNSTCVVPDACVGNPNNPACDAAAAQCEACNADEDCLALGGGQACLENRCVECRDDIDRFCQSTPASRNDGRLECVGTDCVECDPRNHDGCAENGDTPICDIVERACRACANDADCGSRPGESDQCVAGRCQVCDPADNNGCGEAGAPICDTEDDGVEGEPFTCRPCSATAECPVEGGLQLQCVAGVCQGCEPGTNVGCQIGGVTPICDTAEDGVPGVPLVCRACANDGECPPRPGLDDATVCFDDRCRECAPTDHRGCDEAGAAPICVGGDCQPCNDDFQCAQRPGDRDQCIAGECAVCDPADNAGCPDPAAPRCDPGTRTCRACAEDADCNVGGVEGLECVAGQCVGCDPGDNAGCLIDTDLPVCDAANRTCRPCGNRGECGAFGREGCIDGRCTVCDPATEDGCDITEICAPDGRCRTCQADVDCDARPDGRGQCVDNGCFVCDVADNAGCDGDTPVCDGDACRACEDSAECQRGGASGECVDGRCEGCDPDGNVGCEPNQPICDPQNLACRICFGDEECGGGECFGGRCLECDPGAQAGCPAERPFCAADGVCRACANDAECVLVPGAEDQCVDGRCAICDPAGNAGCVPGGDAAICDAGDLTCRGCADDGECGGEQCVDAVCRTCDPADGAGCAANSAAPVCDAFACRGCQDDGECAGNPNGAECVAGACVPCDPADHAGCGEDAADPICDPGARTCRACGNDAECTIRPGARDVCVAGECQFCAVADNQGCTGNTPICDGGDACRACANNGECGDAECLPSGACSNCNPANNAGCGGADPICDADSEVCRPCRDDGECDGGQCVGGRCEVCDPADHAGCALDALCCRDNGTPNCVPTDPATGCAACGQACPNQAAVDSCNDRVCECGDGAACGGGEAFCVDATCGECRSAADCNANSDAPICDLDAPTACRGCVNDGECANHPRGPECVAAGACHVCDPADDAGCSNPLPVCDENAFTCRGCANDGECGDGQCVAGQCRVCDPGDDAGCADPAAPVCGDDFVCRACQDDAECGDAQCVGGQCRVCDPADDEGCANPEPVCGDDFACRACANDGECGDGQCVEGQCRACDPGDDAGCANPMPVCGDDFACRACEGDAECGNGQCVAGQCRDCDPADDAGCNGATPICNDQFVCEACANDGQCGAEQCVDDFCRACDPADNAGCEGDTPICNAAFVCLGCVDDAQCGDQQCLVGGACADCDPADNAGCDDPAAPICGDGFVCRGCEADAECGDGQCVDGQCQVCDPGDEAGCDGDTPFCNDAFACVECEASDNCDDPAAPVCGDDGACRGCEDDAECDGGQCVAGACQICDPADNAGCDGETPVCTDAFECVQCGADGDCAEPTPFCGDDNVCRGCVDDAECNGEQCVEGVCEACDPADNAGCDGDRPLCDDSDFSCVQCFDGNDCADETAPVCEIGECRGCLDDGECDVGVCTDDGSCQLCNPGDNAGCDDPTPLCNAEGFVCVECFDDGDCANGAVCNNDNTCAQEGE